MTKQDGGVHCSRFVKVFNYGLRSRPIRLRFPAGTEHFLPHNVQTWSGDRPKDTVSSLPGSKAAGVVRPIHLHLMPKLRMRGAIPSLRHVPSWRIRRNFNVFTLLYQESKSLPVLRFGMWRIHGLLGRHDVMEIGSLLPKFWKTLFPASWAYFKEKRQHQITT